MIFAHMYKTPNPRRREKIRLSTPHTHQFHVIFLAGLAAGVVSALLSPRMFFLVGLLHAGRRVGRYLPKCQLQTIL
jgi:hypothetical protein